MSLIAQEHHGVERIEASGKLLGMIIRHQHDKPGITFFTPSELSAAGLHASSSGQSNRPARSQPYAAPGIDDAGGPLDPTWAAAR